MLGVIAIVIGGSIMLVRHLDGWTRPVSGDPDSLPAHRKLAITMARPFQLIEWKVYDFIHAFGAKTPPDPDAALNPYVSLCQILLSSNEFLYVE